MATPVETPSAPPAGQMAPEPPAPAGGAPEGTETPVQAAPGMDPQGLPQVPAADGTQVSGRGSNQDVVTPPSTPAAPVAPSQQGQPESKERPEVKDLPPWAQDLIRDTRAEVAKSRVEAKTQAADEARKQMAEDIGRALGIITDDTPDEEKLKPEELRDLLAGERTTAKMARTELAVYRAAQGGGNFNASALLDSRAFLDSIKDVDPTDNEKLAEKIAEAVQANPWLQQPAAVAPEQQQNPPGQQSVPVTPVAQPPAAPPAPPSGGQFAGGPGAQPQDLSSMSIDDFRKLRRETRQ